MAPDGEDLYSKTVMTAPSGNTSRDPRPSSSKFTHISCEEAAASSAIPASPHPNAHFLHEDTRSADVNSSHSKQWPIMGVTQTPIPTPTCTPTQNPVEIRINIEREGSQNACFLSYFQYTLFPASAAAHLGAWYNIPQYTPGRHEVECRNKTCRSCVF